MTDDKEFIVQAGQPFHCPEGHYVCRAAIDIPNDPHQTVSREHFTDWNPRIDLSAPKIPVCPQCQRPWLVFSRGDA